MTIAFEEAKRKFHLANARLGMCRGCADIGDTPSTGAYLCTVCEGMFFDDIRVDEEEDEETENDEDEDENDEDEDEDDEDEDDEDEDDEDEDDEEAKKQQAAIAALNQQQRDFLRSINVSALNRAIDGMQSMFTWTSSPEGDSMWRNIQHRLMEVRMWATRLGKE